MSHESDSTTFSYSSIPSNGGFTAFQYPTASGTNSPAPQIVDQRPVNQFSTEMYFPTIPAPLMSDGETENTNGTGFENGIEGLSPYTLGLTNLSRSNSTYAYTQDPSLSSLPIDNLSSLESMNLAEMESYLNFNIDNLAPPVDDLSFDLEASIQAALRPDPTVFQNLTLAPSPSSSSSSSTGLSSLFSFGNEFANWTIEGNGDGVGGSPTMDYSAKEWFPELSPQEAQSMEMLKVFLDGMDFVASPLGSGSGIPVGDHSSPVEVEIPPSGDSHVINNHGQRLNHDQHIPSMDVNVNANVKMEVSSKGKEVDRSQSPLQSDRATSEGSIATSTSLYSDFTSSMDLEQLPVNIELQTPVDVGTSIDDTRPQGGMSGDGEMEVDGAGWMMGVLPFEMSGEWIESV